jgi:molybdopterin-guanine dinucleotide biosynthesis protein B
MPVARVLGIVGWSGAGKTTLMKQLLPLLVARGLRIATLKHAHHEFEVDLPGKDSWVHRKSGSSEVIVCSSRRWVHIHELEGATEPPLVELLERLAPCDLILVEGFKRDRHPKLEIHRAELGKPLLYPDDPGIRAIATDSALPEGHPPRVDLNDPAAVCEQVLACAHPLPEVLQALSAGPRAPETRETASTRQV